MSFGCSLDHAFAFGSCLVRDPIRLTYALALNSGFLNRMSQPLGATDILSAACHPSQTAHQLVSLLRGKWWSTWKVVLHCCLSYAHKHTPNGSHLHYVTKTAPQQQAAVKFHGVFASHWKSLVFAPGRSFQETLVRDSDDLVIPFMQADIQSARYYAQGLLLILF